MPPRLIIADDNREFSGILKEFLESHSFDVVAVAHDGAQTIDFLNTNQADVLLLDIIMPGMDGITVLEKISDGETACKPKVIMVSAFGQDAVLRRTAELGAAYFVLKPFDMSRLVDAIRTVLGVSAGPSHPSGRRTL